MKNEDAVSPVIGVILMVAVTVILAAVIAAFVFGMASGISKTKAVAATARQTGTSSIVVTWVGGPDNAMVNGYNVTIMPSTGGLISFINVGNTVGNSTILTGGTTRPGSRDRNCRFQRQFSTGRLGYLRLRKKNPPWIQTE